MKVALNKVMIYARDMQKMSAFYEKYFAFKAQADDDGRLIELYPKFGGNHILIHQLGKGAKSGQTSVKLTFEVSKLKAYRTECINKGLRFGAVHQDDELYYSDTKDPDENSVRISTMSQQTDAPTKIALNKVTIYTRNMQRLANFYEKYFAYKSKVVIDEHLIEMYPRYGGCGIVLRPIPQGYKSGQASVKLVFDVKDVNKFRDQCIAAGLKFGVVHDANGYGFCNAKDPDRNSVQISGRTFCD